MKTLISLAAVLLLCVQISAQDEDWGQVRKTIEQNTADMEKAMLNDDTNTLWGMYAEDVVSLPSYEPMMTGMASIKESHQRMKESGFKFDRVDFEVKDVIGSGDMAVEIGTYDMDMTMPGQPQMNDKGKYITVWKKQNDGTWKVRAEMWNSDSMPAPPSSAEGVKN